MIQGGFDKSKMHTLCNFIDVEKCEEADYLKKIITAISAAYRMKRE